MYLPSRAFSPFPFLLYSSSLCSQAKQLLEKFQKTAFLDKVENSAKKRPLEETVDTDTTPSPDKKKPPPS
jgi:hypothetical protein